MGYIETAICRTLVRETGVGGGREGVEGTERRREREREGRGAQREREREREWGR